MTTNDYQWLPMSTDDYRWLPMTTNDYQWLPMTTKDYQRDYQKYYQKDYQKDHQKDYQNTIKKIMPTLMSRMLLEFSDSWILQETGQRNMRNRSGHGMTGCKTRFMFLPSCNPGFFYFSKDPLSRRLYRLRFETRGLYFFPKLVFFSKTQYSWFEFF